MPIITIRFEGVSTDSDRNERELVASESLRLRGPCMDETLTFSDAQQKAVIGLNPKETVTSCTRVILFDAGASNSC